MIADTLSLVIIESSSTTAHANGPENGHLNPDQARPLSYSETWMVICCVAS